MSIFNITALGIILTILKMASGFIIAKFVATYSGPAGMALLGQLQSLVGGLNGLIANQLCQGVVRHTADNKKDGILACSPWWKAATSLIFATLLLTTPFLLFFSTKISLWIFKNPSFYWLIIIATLALPLNAINSLFLSALNGIGDHKKNIILSTISVITSTITTLVLLTIFGINGGLIAVAVNNAISALIVITATRKNPWFYWKKWVGKSNSPKIKNMMGYMAMGFIGAMTGPTAMITVRNIITENTSIISAGLWQASMRISDAYISMLTIGVGMYYFPKAASIHNAIDLKNETKKVLTTIIPLAVLSTILIYTARIKILTTLYSHEFTHAENLFLPQQIGDIFRVIAFIPATVLLARGYFKINALLEVSINFLFVLITLVSTPIFGVIGANYAYAASYFFYMIFCIVFFKHHCKRLEK